MSEIAKRIAGLSPKQYALLMQRLNNKQGDTALSAITPRPRDASVVPLSFAQQRLWILHQIEPQSPSYNVSIPLSVSGVLDVLVLWRCINILVRRHEILRTSFTQVQNQPMQKIAPVLMLRLPVTSLELLAMDARPAQVQRLIVEAARRPFDLAHGPLLRATLLRLADREHVLILSMHHIISDGWSLAILLREMTALYAALTTGRPASLPELPIQYADYAIWQRQHLQGAALDQLLSYWRQQLDHLPAALPLPTDRPRPSLPTFNGAQHPLVIAPDLAAALNTLAQQEGATLFMLLLAAFQVLLARYSGQDDIAVGTPVAGRTRAETEGLIGFFVNTLVLRTRLSRGWSFRNLLRQVREVYLEAYAHQALPFEMLVEALQPERDLGLHPLFQVMFALQNVRIPVAALDNLKLAPLPFDAQTTKFDLTLELSEGAQGLTGTLEYTTDLFDEGTIARMVGHFQTLLAGIVADPQRPIMYLPLLTEAEHQRLLYDWNATDASYPHETVLHALVAAQARRTPDVIALVAGERHLSYRALVHHSNQLAWHLRALGVGPEVPVAVCMERSAELVLGLLGVLTAGGAYVPLDPTYPRARLAFMLSDSGAAVLLTQPALHTEDLATENLAQFDLSSDQRPLRHLDLRAAWRTLAQQPGDPPPTALQPEHLAYVIYTSGSTGQPKGVAMSHRPLVNMICWQIQSASAAGGRRTLQFAPSSFDVSFQEIFATWCAGGTLIMIDEERRRDPVALLRLLADTAVERLFLPYVALRQLAETIGDGVNVLTSLTEIITAGEQLHITPPIAQMLRQLPRCVLHNHYGPSESHAVTAFTLGGAVDSWPPLPPIGRPIANARIYLLDRQLQPVPVGVTGELYIGGIALARGYLHQPDLTAERFVPNPFGEGLGVGGWELGTGRQEDTGTRRHGDTETKGKSPTQSSVLSPQSSRSARLYRTGDHARYRPDGQIEFLGRIDQQVKVRGYRIELGEVEVVLDQHPAVQACVVMAREDVPGDKRLVAYVGLRTEAKGLSAAGTTPTQSSVLSPQSSFLTALRAFLQERLPTYMVPSAIVFLEAFPLTPSGKLDRRALPTPDAARATLETPFVAPQTPTEELLAGIWAEVLGRAEIGRDDNFFALGGHSLLATQVIARLRTTFAVELPLRMLFEAPTLAGLAERVVAARTDHHPLEIPLQPITRNDALPLSFAQQRLWFLDQLQPNSPAYNIPLYLQLRGALDLSALVHSLAALVARHETLRTSFPAINGAPVQRISPSAPLPLTLLDLQALPPDVRAELAQHLVEAEAVRPFDLAAGPLLRATLLRLAPHEHLALLTLHHIVADGWSLGVLLDNLSTLYNAFHCGERPRLAELPIQYADYALWQREWLGGPLLETQLAYWRAHLAGLLPLELPTDHPRPPQPSQRGSSLGFTLPASLSQALAVLSRQFGVTLFMTLLAAFQLLLARYSDQDDLAVGTPIANRSRPDLERLIGFFVNTLVLRTDLSGNPSFRELLGRVREICLAAYAHQDVPFEQLVETLQPARDLSRTPLFQVFFVLQNAPLGALSLPELTLTPLPSSTTQVKFDLTLTLTESTTGLLGQIEYATDLFGPATITRMAEHFQTLLEGIVAQPDARIGELPLLSAHERHLLLDEWNATDASYLHETALHALVAAQARRTPDVIALVAGERHLSYHALVHHSNQLAWHLRALGVEPEVRVAICLERSLELVIAILGVLSAGGAYVPLDPAYPPARLAFMLSDSGAAVLLAQPALHTEDLATENLAQFDLSSDRRPLRHLDLHAAWRTLAQQPGDPSPTALQPEHLAYVIYTSGSTGEAKGVAIAHASVLALIGWTHTRFSAAQLASVLAATSVCFDLSVFELFAPLSIGGTVVLADNALALTTLPDATRLTLVNTVPSAAAELLRLDALPPTVTTLNLAGEALPHLLAQQLYARTHIEQLYNLYGPSEDTTYSTWALVERESPLPPPIGRPITNTQVYLLDRHMQPVPLGIPGELYLGGAGLARGYLNRPDLTAERFVPNPFAIGDWRLGTRGHGDTETRRLGDTETGRPGNRETWDETPTQSSVLSPQSSSRLYRTGDRARYRPDGQIEFLGRIDQQVKLRGFRIELGEIEATLARHPSVQACAVISREDTAADMRLVAYVVPTIDHRPSSDDVELSPVIGHRSSLGSELQDFLRARLPAYMVPSAFVALDALPLTPNGKLDRRALPAPSSSQSWHRQAFVPPRDTLELQLVQTWEEILKVDRVSVADNFFDLGGHSLLAMRLLARIQQLSGRKLPLATLFQHTTIEQLARRLRQPGEYTLWSPIIALQASGTQRPFFCVHPVSGSVLGYVELARALGPDQPFYGLQAAGLEGECAPLSEVADMAQAYIAAVCTVQPEGPYLLGGWSVGGVIAFEMAQQLHAQGQEVALLALLDSAAPNPSQPRASVAEDDPLLLTQFVQDLAGQAGRTLDLSLDTMWQCPAEQRLSAVLEQAQSLGMLPPDISVEQIAARLAVFKANLAAVRRYTPAATPTCVVLLRASEQAEHTTDRLLGWEAVADGALDLIDVPGSHYTMIAQPHVQELAVQLRVCFQNA